MHRTLHEECGVFGVFQLENAPQEVFWGLHELQHRGEEGSGIAVVGADGRISCHKGAGRVAEVFPQGPPADLSGSCAIGHVRYGTSGGGGLDNVQPFVFSRSDGSFAVAHNGNIVNADELKSLLMRSGSIFHSSSDSEVVAHLFFKTGSIEKTLRMLDGAFSLLIMTPDALYACRDKRGFRPLVMGRKGNGYMVGSESCALLAAGAGDIRDIRPGEVVRLSADGVHSSFYSGTFGHSACAMEYIYFARPDSEIDGVGVYAFRREAGRFLCRESAVEADLVMGVPDSGMAAAIGYAHESGLPLETGLIKNFYVGRTFIQPSQFLRDLGVRKKLSPVASIVRGKRLVVLDDSIVRGTTSRKIIALLREAGAAEVHMRICSPPLISPCYYGVDISSEEELLLSRMSIEEACRAIGADSLAFLSEESTLKAAEGAGLCLACFNKNYPTSLYHLGPDHFEN